MRKLAAAVWYFLRQESWILALGLAALLAALLLGALAPSLWHQEPGEFVLATAGAATVALAVLSALLLGARTLGTAAGFAGLRFLLASGVSPLAAWAGALVGSAALALGTCALAALPIPFTSFPAGALRAQGVVFWLAAGAVWALAWALAHVATLLARHRSRWLAAHLLGVVGAGYVLREAFFAAKTLVAAESFFPFLGILLVLCGIAALTASAVTVLRSHADLPVATASSFLLWPLVALVGVGGWGSLGAMEKSAPWRLYRVHRAAVSPDGEKVLVAGEARGFPKLHTRFVWDVRSGKRTPAPQRGFEEWYQDRSNAVFSPDSRFLLVGGGARRGPELVELSTGKRQRLASFGEDALACAAAPGGAEVALATRPEHGPSRLVVVDATSGQVRASLEGALEGFWCQALAGELRVAAVLGGKDATAGAGHFLTLFTRPWGAAGFQERFRVSLAGLAPPLRVGRTLIQPFGSDLLVELGESREDAGEGAEEAAARQLLLLSDAGQVRWVREVPAPGQWFVVGDRVLFLEPQGERWQLSLGDRQGRVLGETTLADRASAPRLICRAAQAPEDRVLLCCLGFPGGREAAFLWSAPRGEPQRLQEAFFWQLQRFTRLGPRIAVMEPEPPTVQGTLWGSPTELVVFDQQAQRFRRVLP